MVAFSAIAFQSRTMLENASALTLLRVSEVELQAHSIIAIGSVLFIERTLLHDNPKGSDFVSGEGARLL
jgi:hypothetical protein